VDGLGNTVFPSFQPTIDGLFGVAKLLEYLARQKMELSDVLDALPAVHRAERRVECPWDHRGRIMRELHERFGEVREPLAEGMELSLGEREWVLMLPSPDEPFIFVYSEADSQARATSIVDEYAQIVRDMLAG
ncbi:MAG: nucleotidyl transferase, partial [Anaerolineae bacterium]|nr:nucleotidyl transferase [Anaerolineae bacterium]